MSEEALKLEIFGLYLNHDKTVPQASIVLDAVWPGKPWLSQRLSKV